MAVERTMSSELLALKQELQQKGTHNRPLEEELVSAMREQVAIYCASTLKVNQGQSLIWEGLSSQMFPALRTSCTRTNRMTTTLSVCCFVLFFCTSCQKCWLCCQLVQVCVLGSTFKTLHKNKTWNIYIKNGKWYKSQHIKKKKVL